MAEDLMRYDLLVQEALRRVVRLALLRVARTGLPGDHHFFIAINNRHDGVKLSDRLRRKYPNEMTIVLQHQFWNLAVHERHFEVDLSFDNIPEKLSISFEAVKGFFDPLGPVRAAVRGDPGRPARGPARGGAGAGNDQREQCRAGGRRGQGGTRAREDRVARPVSEKGGGGQ